MTALHASFQEYRARATTAAQMEEIPMDAVLSLDEWARAQDGFRPRDMDDKWRVGYAAPFLEFYRSWTHTLVFKLRIDVREDGVHCGPLYAARGEDWYKPNPDPEWDEVALVKKVMQWTLGLEGFADR